jgi:hypothetical protein
MADQVREHLRNVDRLVLEGSADPDAVEAAGTPEERGPTQESLV